MPFFAAIPLASILTELGIGAATALGFEFFHRGRERRERQAQLSAEAFDQFGMRSALRQQAIQLALSNRIRNVGEVADALDTLTPASAIGPEATQPLLELQQLIAARAPDLGRAAVRHPPSIIETIAAQALAGT